MMRGIPDDADTDIQPVFQNAVLRIAEYLVVCSPSTESTDYR